MSDSSSVDPDSPEVRTDLLSLSQERLQILFAEGRQEDINRFLKNYLASPQFNGLTSVEKGRFYLFLASLDLEAKNAEADEELKRLKEKQRQLSEQLSK